jgi:hypothetical protein
MSHSPQIQLSQHKSQPIKAVSQVKAAPKPQSSGLTREEIRRIVIEMIG